MRSVWKKILCRIKIILVEVMVKMIMGIMLVVMMMNVETNTSLWAVWLMFDGSGRT